MARGGCAAWRRGGGGGALSSEPIPPGHATLASSPSARLGLRPGKQRGLTSSFVRDRQDLLQRQVCGSTFPLLALSFFGLVGAAEGRSELTRLLACLTLGRRGRRVRVQVRRFLSTPSFSTHSPTLKRAVMSGPSAALKSLARPIACTSSASFLQLLSSSTDDSCSTRLLLAQACHPP